MSLYRDIEKATMIPLVSNNTKFVRLKGPSQALKDKKVNERRLQLPKNIKLLETDDSDTFDNLDPERYLNEHEITSSIKIAHGGISFENEHLEYHLQSRQRKGAQKSESPEGSQSSNDSSSSTIRDDSTETFENEDLNVSKLSEDIKETVADKKEVLRKCGLSRNAAIGGLFMLNKISNNTGTCDKTNDRSDEIRLVPLPEDSEVFVQPWQAYGKLDENRCKNIDFTVDHVGKKKTVTARQYYIMETDDSSFQFVRKKTHKLPR